MAVAKTAAFRTNCRECSLQDKVNRYTIQNAIITLPTNVAISSAI